MAGLVSAFVSRGRPYNVDFNNLIETGMYKIQKDVTGDIPNQPQGAYGYGILLVFKPVNDPDNRILQIYVSHVPMKVYVRICNGTTAEAWGKWVELSSTVVG